MTEPSTITRYSSRTARLDQDFLKKRLKNARQYDRIAGYFRSSIFDIASEELSSVGKIRIICNSDLDPDDLAASQIAQGGPLLEKFWTTDTTGLSVAADAILHQEKYRLLTNLLKQKTANNEPRVEIRVIDRTKAPLLHGKAGLITQESGEQCCFIGSVNETREAWTRHHEFLWEDTSPEAISWTQTEFDAFWNDKSAIPLPEAIIDELERRATRTETSIDAVSSYAPDKPVDLPRAIMAESPMAKTGETLQPWQKEFVAEFLRQRETYGKARLILADEVGVGKTLSLAVAALLTVLISDGPTLLLVPATLMQQWQTELWDRLKIPTARWHTSTKCWIDQNNHIIRTNGAADVTRCPCQIAIVSTGLIFHGKNEHGEWQNEAKSLLNKRNIKQPKNVKNRLPDHAYGTVIIDESHKARRIQTIDKSENNPNNLKEFLLEIAWKTLHIIPATATPIQTSILDLWDLLEIIATNADHVLGTTTSPWRNPEEVKLLLTGEHAPNTEEDAWLWLQNPLPPPNDRQSGTLIRCIRNDLNIPDDVFIATDKSFLNLEETPTREMLREELERITPAKFFQINNPLVRHIILRKRKDLEDAGLMKRIAVNLNPTPKENDPDIQKLFDPSTNSAITPEDVRDALDRATTYIQSLSQRRKGTGFMKKLLEQRICSSLSSGLKTLQALHNNQMETLKEQFDDDIEEKPNLLEEIKKPSPEEQRCLADAIQKLEQILQEDGDPKLNIIKAFLIKKDWASEGCILFSQYFDTAEYFAHAIAQIVPEVPIALYAGANKSGIYRNSQFSNVERDSIKTAVKEKTISLVFATDAACEGLNLQTLGTLINIDMPWNPSRLEQRLGRIKRFGQKRNEVSMLNIYYKNTIDETICSALSERMKDKYDIFGQLPDTLEDHWISEARSLQENIEVFVQKQKSENAFDLRWGAASQSRKPQSETESEKYWKKSWEKCSAIIPQNQIFEKLSLPW